MSVPTKKPRLPRPSLRGNAPVIDLAEHKTAPPASVGFAAQIEGATMADLIQLECTRGLTRAVRVTADGKTGFLYFDQGEVVHAVAGPLKGEEAAREILTWKGGTVRPSDSYWVNPPTIRLSWQALLISAAHDQDESERADSEVVALESLEEVDWEPEPQKEEPVEADTPPEVTRLVVLDAHGQVLRSAGETEEFADAAAYSVRLAQLIGEALGLEAFQGLECTSRKKVLLAYVEEGTTVALEAPATTPLQSYRKKAGL